MYSTFGSSRLPVICEVSSSRRSLALPLAAVCVAGLAALLAAPLLAAAAGLAVVAGFVVRAGAGGCEAGAEVSTPGSIVSAALGVGVCAFASPATARANNMLVRFDVRFMGQPPSGFGAASAPGAARLAALLRALSSAIQPLTGLSSLVSVLYVSSSVCAATGSSRN